MSGLFDFLGKDLGGGFGQPQQPPVQQEQATAMMPATQSPPPEGLLHPPQQVEGPGLLERLRTPNDSGVSWADKLYAIGGVLGGDSAGGMQYLQGKQKDARAQKLLDQAKADHAAKNAAFRAAYKDGRFDPAAYAAALGSADVDPSDIAQLSKTFAPQGGVEGGRSYTKNPSTGAITWGDSAPPTAADLEHQAAEAERERHQRIVEDYMLRGLGIKQQNADAGTFRAHKAPAGAAPSWLPPGARVVHMPGT